MSQLLTARACQNWDLHMSPDDDPPAVPRVVTQRRGKAAWGQDRVRKQGPPSFLTLRSLTVIAICPRNPLCKGWRSAKAYDGAASRDSCTGQKVSR